MHEDEKKVRDAWVLTHCCDGSYRHYIRGTILLQDKHSHWLDFVSWSAAAAFTDERKKQIAEIDEEIDVIQKILSSYVSHGGATFKRILSRLQAARAELRRGMRG